MASTRMNSSTRCRYDEKRTAHRSRLRHDGQIETTRGYADRDGRCIPPRPASNRRRAGRGFEARGIVIGSLAGFAEPQPALRHSAAPQKRPLDSEHASRSEPYAAEQKARRLWNPNDQIVR